jgi:hypothetical protein
VPPLLRLISIFTAPAVPRLCFQVMALALPISHSAPLFGAVTVTNGVAIVKLLSLASLAAPPAALTRMRADVVVGLVTAQVYEPDVALAFAIDVAIGLHVAPPSRLTSRSTALFAPRLCVHAIVCVEPTPQLTFVFGVVTVMTGLAIVTVVVLGGDVATPSLTTKLAV